MIKNDEEKQASPQDLLSCPSGQIQIILVLYTAIVGHIPSQFGSAWGAAPSITQHNQGRPSHFFLVLQTHR